MRWCSKQIISGSLWEGALGTGFRLSGVIAGLGALKPSWILLKRAQAVTCQGARCEIYL